MIFAAVTLVVCSSKAEDKARLTLSDFTRPRLLERFDSDRDGHLNAVEGNALRAAFGGIDVPLLPVKSGQYRLGEISSHLGPLKMHALDNTSASNPISDAGAQLGRVLFYDKLLSKNDSISCASCHLQERAFADPRQFSIGFEGGMTSRNAMGLGYSRFTLIKGSRPGFFWDERAATLEDQVLLPIQDKVEMGMQLNDLERKLQSQPYYPPLFEAAFGSREVTSKKIAKAIAQFMRSLVSFDSKFDRAAKATGGTDYSQAFSNFTDQENLGKSLFIDGVGAIAEIGCAHCHVPPTFGMPKSFNNGLDLQYTDRGLGARDVPSNDPFTANNDGKFKAPALRNIALTSPYMHDGRFTTLDQVVEHYSSGVHPHVNLGLAFKVEHDANDSETSGFQLTPPQKSAIVAFLKTLTDKNLNSHPKFSDPFVRSKD
ncbi:MAG: cytochrome c peroxidase [Pirellulaceae bacterium]|jgi:cytochrome c peroxidase